MHELFNHSCHSHDGQQLLATSMLVAVQWVVQLWLNGVVLLSWHAMTGDVAAEDGDDVVAPCDAVALPNSKRFPNDWVCLELNETSDDLVQSAATVVASVMKEMKILQLLQRAAIAVMPPNVLGPCDAVRRPNWIADPKNCRHHLLVIATILMRLAA